MNSIGGPGRNARVALSGGAIAIAAAPSLITSFPAGDLHEHVYNAWLSHLAMRGEVTGLWLERTWTNCLVSRALEVLISMLSPGAVERVVQFTLAQAFLWAAFLYCRAISNRGCWEWLPALAMLAIGWTYQTGLVNWYASAALSLVAAAQLSKAGSSWRSRCLAAALLAVAATGNALPPVWAVSSATLALAHGRSPTTGRRVALWLSSGIVAAGIVTVLLGRGRYPVRQLLAAWVGADQLFIHGAWYAAFSAALLVIWSGALLDVRRDPEARGSPAPLLALYAAVFVLVVPDILLVPGYGVPAFFVARRGTLIAGVALTAAAAGARWSPGRAAALACVSSGWLALLVADSAILARLQERMNAAVARLPPGTRVATSMTFPFSSALFRACTGVCFVWSNHQPASGQFRLAASEENSFTVGRFRDYMAMEVGRYRVPSLPFPLWEVAPCEEPAPPEDVCLRLLAPGDLLHKGCVDYFSGPAWNRSSCRCSEEDVARQETGAAITPLVWGTTARSVPAPGAGAPFPPVASSSD